MTAGSRFVDAVYALTRRRIEIFDGAGDDWRFAESLKSISEDAAQEYEGRAVLELVQNGHDALVEGPPGRIAVLLDLTSAPGVLYVANEGAPFTEDNFKAITELALSDKGAGEGIGNKGLGFRSVLQLTDWPEIHSRAAAGSAGLDGYCFRFADTPDIAALVGDDPGLVERVAGQVSPLALPVPADGDDPVLADLAGQGYSTVVRLPLRSPQAAEAAAAQVRSLAADDAPILLFLDRISTLAAEIRGGGPVGQESPETFALSRTARPPGWAQDQDWLARVDLGPAGLYLVGRRPLDPEPLADAIGRSVASREVDERWGRWDGSGGWVGLALRLDEPLPAGRLYTFLPMAETAAAPLAAHAHAPFFTTLARLGMSDTVPLNDHLLDELAALAARMIRTVRAAAPHAAAAVLVPDLAAWRPAARLDRALGGSLADEPVVPLAGGRGWGTLNGSYDWPDRAHSWQSLTRTALAGLGQDVLDADLVGGPRRGRLLALHEQVLGNVMSPDLATVADWAEQTAQGLPSPDGPAALGRWAAYYDDLQQAFHAGPAVLRGRRIVVDHYGGVRRALGGTAGRDDTLFFSPDTMAGHGAARIPSDLRTLRTRMAFTHPDVPWSKAARAFFEDHALVREYRTERVFDALRDLLAGTKSDPLRRDCLLFAHRQFPALSAAQRASLAGVGFYVPQADGTWAPAGRSLMSPAWGAGGARRLERVLAAGGDALPELDAMRSVFVADPKGWPGGVADPDGYAVFLAAIGVRDGLVPQAVVTVAERQGNQLAPFLLARQFGLPDDVAAGWSADVAAGWNGGRYPYTKYAFAQPLVSLPGVAGAEGLPPVARRELAELVLHGLGQWEDKYFDVTLWRPNRAVGQQDPHRWPTPLSSALRHGSWLPVAADDAGGLDFVRPSQAWHSADGDLPPFVPALPLGVRRALADPAVLGRAVTAGLRLWENPAHAAAAVRDLGAVLDQGGVPDHLSVAFRRHYARAFAEAARAGDWAWPAAGRAVLACVVDGRLRAVPAGDEAAIYVPDVHAPLKQSLVELAGHPVLVADPDAGAETAALLSAHGEKAVRLSQVDVKVFSEQTEIRPDPSRPLLVAGREWLVIAAALALELKSGSFVRRSEKALLALLAQLRTVRVARVADVTVSVGGTETVPAASVRSVPLPDPFCPTIAVWDVDGEGEELQACAPAVAHLLGQPYLHDAMELALIKIEKMVGAGASPDDGVLARAFDTTVARVGELRRSLAGDVDGLRRRLLPALESVRVGRSGPSPGKSSTAATTRTRSRWPSARGRTPWADQARTSSRCSARRAAWTSSATASGSTSPRSTVLWPRSARRTSR